MLSGSLLLVLVPLLVFAVGIRKVVRERLVAQYDRRVELLVSMLDRDMTRQGAVVATRLEALARSLTEDNRFRRGVQGYAAERSYVLDYAGRAARQSGLDMLFILDQDGRILSSAHFRNEYDRVEPDLVDGVGASGQGTILVAVRTATGEFTALAKADSTRLGGRVLSLVGGVDFDRRLLNRWDWDENLSVTLEGAAAEPLDSGALSPVSAGMVVRELPVNYLAVDGTGRRTAMPGSVRATHSLAPLRSLARSVDRWFLVALVVTVLAALGAAGWVSLRLSRPLTELAEKTSHLDLDHLDVDFPTDRTDEIGSLSRLLGAMTSRLKSSASLLRDAERRATVGEFARQVNHDIKNGLTPIRNVVRHLVEVVRGEPGRLPAVFLERQATLDTSLAYLETLAANYARLSPVTATKPCDIGGIVRRVVEGARALGTGPIELDVAAPLPRVRGDPVAIQRVLENLVRNSVASLEGDKGSVTVSTALLSDAAGVDGVRITVADTGRGMSEDELNRIFDDFYTTTPGGTGLGLSIVRRLVGDLDGRLRIESAPGTGTRVTIDLPAVATGATEASTENPNASPIRGKHL
jgi:signal transduction histidine kinase